MSEAITSKYNEEVELTLLLRNKSNKPGGRILATVRLEELPPAKDIEYLIPDSFSTGEFRLSRIVGYGLPQADILTKSDPYVTLQLPNGSEYVTNTLLNSGATGGYTHSLTHSPTYSFTHSLTHSQQGFGTHLIVHFN